MAKAKSPKLHLSLLASLQICRPKTPNSMIKSPLPHAPYMLSSLNSKTLDISFPGTPIPPPSTPSSKIAPLDCGFPSSSKNGAKTLNSPRSSDSEDEPDWRVPSSRYDKKKHRNAKQKSKSCIRSRTSSSSRNSSTETDSLFSSPPSFNSSCSAHPLKTVYEEELFNGGSRKEAKRRFKRYGSKEWKEGEECSEKKPLMLGRLAPCMSEQSFVVVKKSVDPYEDFKKSMSEMIVAKQIFEPKELEHLLMSFLSLNSRLHHKVIIEAFTQILKDVFSG